MNCEYRGASALYWAAVNGQVDRVTLLLQHGADPTTAKCANSGPGVKANFAKACELIAGALRSSPTK